VSVPNDAVTNCVMKSGGTWRRILDIEAAEIAWGSEAQCIPKVKHSAYRKVEGEETDKYPLYVPPKRRGVV